MTTVDMPMLLRVVYGEVARLRFPRTMDRQDICQEAALGCLQALSRYDPARGLKVQTLMSSRARGAALDYLRTLDPCGRTLRKRVKCGLASPVIVLRFDEWDAEEKPDYRIIPPDVLAALAERERHLNAALRKLSDREWSVVALTLWCGFTMREIGQRLGVTEGRVCQLRKRAVRKIRAYLEADKP